MSTPLDGHERRADGSLAEQEGGKAEREAMSLKLYLHAFWHAIAFLTRIPVPKQLDPAAWRHSSPLYPVVGVVLGGVLACVALLLEDRLPPFVLAMLLVTLWVYLTGGLHLDGLMDTADGFGSHRPRERVLEIMKDSRVGGMGVLAAVLLLGNKAMVLAHLHGTELWLGLLMATVWGRAVMLVALYAFPYARADGLAQTLRTRPVWYQLWPLVLALPALFLLKGALLISVLACWMLIATAKRKIGGLTGDVYGALCELAEVTFLLGCLLA